jgi:type IV pilus assembly protein PilA
MDKDDDAGFTLIELLVVIIIIGILAAIAIPVFLSQKSKGYEASMKSDLRTAATEIEAANTDNQDYTLTFFGGAKAVAGTSTVSAPSGNVGVNATNTIRLSSGNKLTWVGATATSFCLKAETTKISSSPPIWYYTNTGGGLTKTACTT